MLAAFLSLAGMPPFGGFVGKVVVFAAGITGSVRLVGRNWHHQFCHRRVLLF